MNATRKTLQTLDVSWNMTHKCLIALIEWIKRAPKHHRGENLVKIVLTSTKC